MNEEKVHLHCLIRDHPSACWELAAANESQRKLSSALCSKQGRLAAGQLT